MRGPGLVKDGNIARVLSGGHLDSAPDTCDLVLSVNGKQMYTTCEVHDRDSLSLRRAGAICIVLYKCGSWRNTGARFGILDYRYGQ